MSHHVKKIGSFLLGTDYPPLFLAEIGTFFDKDITLAKQLIRMILAASQEVPQQPLMCKLEILNNPEICLDVAYFEQYQNKSGHVKKEHYRQLIERKIVPLSYYQEIFSFLNDINLPFVVSVYEPEAAEFAIECGASALKIASGNLVHIPLIRSIAGLGVPLIIDTGRSRLSEVYHAYETAIKAGCQNLIIEHSPDGHPAAPAAHNLRMLQTYHQCFNVCVGLSDHYIGNEILFMAVALGASVLEKGVFHQTDALDQDISHAMDINSLATVLDQVYKAWQAMGATIRNPDTPLTGTLGSSYRSCLVARKKLAEGDLINMDNVTFAFPCLGIPVQHWDMVVNWKISGAVDAGQPITWDDVTHGVQ